MVAPVGVVPIDRGVIDVRRGPRAHRVRARGTGIATHLLDVDDKLVGAGQPHVRPQVFLRAGPPHRTLSVTRAAAIEWWSRTRPVRVYLRVSLTGSASTS